MCGVGVSNTESLEFRRELAGVDGVAAGVVVVVVGVVGAAEG